MILEDVEITPREIPEHTYLLLGCVELEYAKAYYDWCKREGKTPVA